jgi:hypothetical protein
MWAWLVLIAFTAPSLWSCTCFIWPSAKGAWETAPLVFLGHVERTDVEFDESGDPLPGHEWQGGDQKAWIKVDEAFKGTQVDAEILLEQPVHSCSSAVRAGEHYLFYLDPGQKKGTWVARGCDRSRQVEQAADDLLFLRALPWAAKRSRLSGELELDEDSLAKGFRRVRKLGGVPVRIRGAGQLIETITNADGVYEVYDLPEGSYSVEPEVPKGLVIRFPMYAGGAQAPGPANRFGISLSSGAGASLSFSLREDNLVSGRLVDPAGKPIADIAIDLEPVEGVTPSSRVPYTRTKDDGTFLIEAFPSGDFLLVANNSGSISGSVPFGRVYFPGRVDREKAQVLAISAGKHIEDLVLTVPKLEPTVSLSGKVQFSDGQPAAKARLYLLNGDKKEPSYVSSESNGVFHVSLLAGRPVWLQAEWHMVSRTPRADCPQLTWTKGNAYAVADIKSEPVPVSAETNQAGLILTLPGPACKTP